MSGYFSNSFQTHPFTVLGCKLGSASCIILKRSTQRTPFGLFSNISKIIAYIRPVIVVGFLGWIFMYTHTIAPVIFLMLDVATVYSQYVRANISTIFRR